MSSFKKMDRRSFIKTTAAAGAVAYLAPTAFGKRLPSKPVLETYKTTTATHWGSV